MDVQLDVSNIKVGVAMPTSGSIKTDTVISLFNLTNSGVSVQMLFTKGGSIIPDSRKKLVLQGFENKCTHIFFVDSDMILEYQTLERLLLHKKDIIGTNAHIKALPVQSVVKLLGENGKRVAGEVSKELFKCYAIGFGCALINIDVFNHIEKPWFLFDYDEEENIIGEDVYFCEKARAAGFDVWCDATILAGHIGDYVY